LTFGSGQPVSTVDLGWLVLSIGPDSLVSFITPTGFLDFCPNLSYSSQPFPWNGQFQPWARPGLWSGLAWSSSLELRSRSARDSLSSSLTQAQNIFLRIC